MPEIIKCRRVNEPKNQEKQIVICQPSEWANPYDLARHGGATQVRQLFSEWLKTQGELLYRIDELRDKDLICRNSDVHGELLMFLANGTKEQRTAWWSSRDHVDVFLSGIA